MRLVGVRDGEGCGSVVVAGDVEIAEPGRPVVVEVAVDADRVCRGCGVHESARDLLRSWGLESRSGGWRRRWAEGTTAGALASWISRSVPAAVGSLSVGGATGKGQLRLAAQGVTG